MRYAIIALSLLTSLSFAQEGIIISALDSIEENVVGFSLGGNAKGGILYSGLDAKNSDNIDESFSDYLAFSDFLLRFSVSPSNETRATFDLRFHKDWQSAYREGNNSPIIRWWSYDGNILDKKLKFNLGTMRVVHTPLTIYLPEPNLIMEPEIFADLKKEAMEERYLDGTNRRILQGLNVEYAISAGVFDKIFLQGTIARLRKVVDEKDRIFFDFDPNKDRFSTAARVGIEAYGISFGINDVYTFNRFSSSVLDVYTDTSQHTDLDYEKNNVLSIELGYNSKKQFSPVDFGVSAEYALSSWSNWRHVKYMADSVKILAFDSTSIPSVVTPCVYDNISESKKCYPNYYPYYKNVAPSYKRSKYKLTLIEELNGQTALLGNAYVSYNDNPLEIKLSGHFLKTDKDFESELAASPAYLPNLPILNSDAALESNLQQFRTSSLENLYYSHYYTLPLTIMTIVDGQQGDPYNASQPVCKGTRDRLYQAMCLDNNYKLAHYYRNAYTQQTYTKLERRDSSSFVSHLDPSVNLALPNGYATNDRTGGDVDLNFVWNKAINVRGVFGMYSSEDADYTRMGGGAEINIARIIDFSKALAISGSFEQNKKGDTIQTNRIMAGLKVGIWRGLSLIGGFQQLSKEFEKPYLGVIDKIGESLVLGGPQIKISERANFNLQYGVLSNSIEGNAIKYDLDKTIMSAAVKVEF